MHIEKFAFAPIVIGGKPDFRSPEERIEFAFSLAMNLRAEIEEKLSKKASTITDKRQ